MQCFVIIGSHQRDTDMCTSMFEGVQKQTVTRCAGVFLSEEKCKGTIEDYKEQWPTYTWSYEVGTITE